MPNAPLRSFLRELTDQGLADLFPDASLDRLLAATVDEFWQLEDWPFTWRQVELVTDAFGAVALPAGARRVASVRQLVAGSRPLTCVSREPAHWAGWMPAEPAEPVTEPVGRPVEYFTADGVLWVWPAAGARVVVRFKAAPPVEKAEAFEAVPAEFHAPLVYGAAARLLSQEADDTKRVGAYQAEYETGVERARRELLRAGSKPVLLGGRARRLRGVGRRV